MVLIEAQKRIVKPYLGLTPWRNSLITTVIPQRRGCGFKVFLPGVAGLSIRNHAL